MSSHFMYVEFYGKKGVGFNYYGQLCKQSAIMSKKDKSGDFNLSDAGVT